MLISVAICTWNRADLLDQTLNKFCSLFIPKGHEWELIIVNNNCTDNTDAIISKYQDRLPIKRIFEPEQGLSNARNAALANAKGIYILWTDDDVLVDENWVSAYIDAFEKWVDVEIFGGKVLPWFESNPPKWLEENIDLLGSYFALRDFGDEDKFLNENEYPYGASIAFRTESLKKHKFNPNLGRKGNALIGGEEIEIINILRQKGAKTIWVSMSIVQHFLPISRMKLSYIRDYHYNLGLLDSIHGVSGVKLIFGRPRWMLLRWIKCEYYYRVYRILRKKSSIWLTSMMDASRLKGRLNVNYENNK